MIVRARISQGIPITLNMQPGGLTVAWDEQTVLAYDRAGRLWSAFFNGCTFRRGLDGGLLGKWTQAGRRRRAHLWPSETSLLVERCARLMDRLAAEATVEAPPEVRQELALLLDRASRFTAERARADAQQFLQIYKPIGILPPDQYLALVLQLTEGCSFNRCTFCTFYRGRPFHIKSPDEFRAHVTAVCDYMGDSLSLRRGIFLADANALVIPQRRLIPLLDILQEKLSSLAPALRSFRLHPFPVSAFLDGFSGRKKSAADYAELAARGLKRVYIGLESGHDPLLAWLHKPGCAHDTVEAVHAIKTGGVNVCVIILLGAGGDRFAAGHVRDTLHAVNAMPLGAGDLIYFSEFVSQPGQPYGQIASRDHVEPLSDEDLRAQRRAIEAGLVLAGPRPRVARYDIREFIY